MVGAALCGCSCRQRSGLFFSKDWGWHHPSQRAFCWPNDVLGLTACALLSTNLLTRTGAALGLLRHTYAMGERLQFIDFWGVADRNLLANMGWGKGWVGKGLRLRLFGGVMCKACARAIP